ncbi:MAG: type III pantothenate kinase [Bacteroidota bacterium]
MNLIIDVGNTFIKLAVFQQNELLHKVNSTSEDFVSTLASLHVSYPEIHYGIVSSVGAFSQTQLNMLMATVPLLILSHETNLPFTNEYATPTTLGVDRIALVSAAAAQYPKENVLIIDAGSCITYDFLNAENSYLGGAISPGIEMRYKAMNHYTANLPLLDTEIPEHLIGDSTNNSMHIGVILGVLNELEGFIDRYNENFPDLTVILTGGDAHFLRDRIKNDIFANSNFLLEGLNHILEINKD